MSTAEEQPSPAAILFARGVIARLEIWPALRLAVQNSWGGPESAAKRTWLASVVVDAFTEAPSPSQVPDVQYVEETLLQVMEDEFEVVLEDESAVVVARDIVRLWVHVADAMGSETVRKWEADAESAKGRRLHAEEEAGSGSDWEDDGESGESDSQEEAPELIERTDDTNARKKEEPVVDEDGFTLVQNKNKGRR